MTEAQFQAKVEELCDKYSILYHHCKDGRKCDGKGLPDLILVGTIVLFAELKTEVGVMSTDQRKWKWAIEGATNGYHEVWRPADLHGGVIERILIQMSPADLGL